MGVAVGDYDRDGRARPPRHQLRRRLQRPLPQRRRRPLLRRELRLAGSATPSIPFLGWGTHFLDYDNDGWLDLFVANGHVYPLVDRFDWNTSYRQRPLLFRNLKGKFVEVGGSAGDGLAVPAACAAPRPATSTTTATWTSSRTTSTTRPLLLRNDGGNRAGHWLAVRLVGDPGAPVPARRDRLAWSSCTAGGGRQRGEVASGRSQSSQSDLRVHFGLGTATRVERLEVRWANGPTVAYEVPGVDRQLVIDQVAASSRANRASRGRRRAMRRCIA